MSSRLKYVLDGMYNYRWIHIVIIIFNAMIIFVAGIDLIDLKNYGLKSDRETSNGITTYR